MYFTESKIVRWCSGRCVFVYGLFGILWNLFLNSSSDGELTSFEENLTLKNFFWFYVFLKFYVNQVKVWFPEGALFLGASGIFQSLTERISPSPHGLLQTPVRGCLPPPCHGGVSEYPTCEGPREMQAATSFPGSCRSSGLAERSWRGARLGGP